MRTQSIKENKCSILTIAGLAVIVIGIVMCTFIAVANSQDLQNISNLERSCKFGMKAATVMYCALRFSVYIFLIYRIDLVNPASYRSKFIILVKWMIIICDITGVAIALIFTQGSLVHGEVVSCRGRFNQYILFSVAFVDFLICFIALTYFLRPLKNINQTFRAYNLPDNEIFLRVIWKMRFYGYIMILSTVIAICVAGIFGGLPLIYAADAGITSVALVLIYERKDHIFGERQISLSVVNRENLRKLTAEYKFAPEKAAVDIENTFSSADLETLSSIQKIYASDMQRVSLNEENSGERGSTEFISERSGGTDHELRVYELKDDNTGDDTKQEPSAKLVYPEIVLEISREESLEDGKYRHNSVIVVHENLKSPEWQSSFNIKKL